MNDTATTVDAELGEVTIVREYDAPREMVFRAMVEPEQLAQFWGPVGIHSPADRMVLEPRVGGHVYDRGVDGSECRWARVLAFEPPNRVLLSWDISPRWQIETDPDKTSEWEVRFIAETPSRTRLELEHRHLERHGQGWEGVREGVEGDQGWPLYLKRFAERIAGEA